MPAPKRRRPGEARVVITQAARTLFAEKGYQGASLRHVAERADVNEALIFRHFGTKERLFHETVVEPFQTFVADLLTRWQQRDTPLSNDDLVALFVGDFYDFARENQDILFALINAERFADDTGTAALAGLSAAVSRIAAASTGEAQQRGIAHVDFQIVVPCVMAMILGTVLLDPWLFPAGANHPREQDLRDWLITHSTRAIH